MTLIPFPRNVLQSAQWQQAGGRLNRQRSAFTGRGPELDFGTAARWQVTGEVVPMNLLTRRAYAAFDAACQVPGAEFRLPAVEQSQYGALDNIVPNAVLAGGASGWLLTNLITRAALPDSADASGFAPFDTGFFHQSSFGPGGAQANGGVAIPIGLAKLFVSAWSLFGSGSTGTNSLRLEWQDSGGSVLSTSVLAMDPGALAANTWHFFSGSFTPPASTAKVRIFFFPNITAGSALFGLPRVSTLPASCTAAAGSSGRTLALANLATSLAHLQRGDLLTVTLPSGDEQLVRLTAPLVSSVSGTATASLATPLREVPSVGAAVQLAEPWGLMRATHAPGWGATPGPIYAHEFSAEESY